MVTLTGYHENLLNIENLYLKFSFQLVDHCECTPLLHLKIKKHFKLYHDDYFCIKYNGIGLWMKIH